MADKEGRVTRNSINDDSEGSNTSPQLSVEQLLSSLSGDRFRDWYHERQYRQNIENGTPFFNGPASVPDSERHSPSRLLKCHRKVVYQQCNAPEETSDPDGIFWFGTRFEEDIAFPFLERAITNADTYVQNSVWVDFRVETKGVELQIKGETDPLIVDADATPILPTEIKTKSSVEHTSEPNRSHRAQLHAYMAGLSEKFGVDLTDGVVMYGSRKTMDVKIFHVEFDEEFWEDVVLEWAADHTHYRLTEELPPAEPENDWECKFCSFRERCGKGDSNHKDLGTDGFLPNFADYPREKVVRYLESNPDALLTPVLAEKYPDVADEYGVCTFQCPGCASSFEWDSIDGQDRVGRSRPVCPVCAEDDSLRELQISPHEQRRSSNEEKGVTGEGS